MPEKLVGINLSEPEPEPEPERTSTGTEAPVVEAKPAETPGAEGGEAKATTDETADILGVSPEMLEKLKSTPEGLELYRSLNKKATEKFQEISAQKRFLDTLKKYPQEVVREMAKHLRLQLGEVPTPKEEKKLEAAVDSFTKRFGPEVGKALREAAEEFFDEKSAPEREAQRERAVKSFADAFIKEHPDVKPGTELASKMEEMMGQFPLSEGKEGETAEELQERINSYLGILYSAATSGKSKTAVTKEVTARMQESVKTVEPVRGVTKPGEKGYRSGMKIADVFEDIAGQ